MQFDMATLATQDRYKLMSSSITPRPIAWVTSLSEEGKANAAPYSFFNMVSADPPLVVLGLMRRPEGSHKDTAANILATGEFVVNLVSDQDAEAMNFTCIDGPPDFDEIAAAKLMTTPATMVKPPLIASAPVSMECRLFQSIEPSAATTIVIGEVINIHIADQFVNADNLHVDTLAMDLVARLHGAGWYTRSTDLFQMTRPSYADFIKDSAE